MPLAKYVSCWMKLPDKPAEQQWIYFLFWEVHSSSGRLLAFLHMRTPSRIKKYGSYLINLRNSVFAGLFSENFFFLLRKVHSSQTYLYLYTRETALYRCKVNLWRGWVTEFHHHVGTKLSEASSNMVLNNLIMTPTNANHATIAAAELHRCTYIFSYILKFATYVLLLICIIGGIIEYDHENVEKCLLYCIFELFISRWHLLLLLSRYYVANPSLCLGYAQTCWVCNGSSLVLFLCVQISLCYFSLSFHLIDFKPWQTLAQGSLCIEVLCYDFFLRIIRIFWITITINVQFCWAISPWVFIQSTSNVSTLILRYWSLMVWFF